MKKTRAQICKDHRIKMLGYGLKPFQDFVSTDENARQELREFIKDLNKRYNCVVLK